MSDPRGHLSEEELILHHYRESTDVSVQAHARSCAVCRSELERLTQTLALVDTQVVPDPGPAFERTVWARLEPQLPLRRRSVFARWRQAVFAPKGSAGASFGLAARLGTAAAAVAILIVAFVAGRLSTGTAGPPEVTTTAAVGGDVAERVFVVAVGDHLDRSQMVLLEVLNADLATPDGLAGERVRARDLVAANRLYRQTAVSSGDARTSDLLDELERVLLEIANASAENSADSLDDLRGRIAARGLLFKVRVVHSEMRAREQETSFSGSSS